MQTKKGYTVHKHNGKLYVMLSVCGQNFKCLLGNAKYLKEIEGVNTISNEQYFSKTVEFIQRAKNIANLYITASYYDENECNKSIDRYCQSQLNPETVFNSYVRFWVNYYFEEKRK